MPKNIIPYSKSHESMAWAELRSIYDRGKEVQSETDAERVADDFERWVSERPETYQFLLNDFLDGD